MAKKKSAAKHHNPLESPIVQIGVVFIILCALFLMFYAGQYKASMMNLGY